MITDAFAAAAPTPRPGRSCNFVTNLSGAWSYSANLNGSVVITPGLILNFPLKISVPERFTV